MNDDREIRRYACHCFSSRERHDVVLFLYDEHSSVVAQVFALPDGEPLPPAEQRDGRTLLYFHRAGIPHVVDMLRNEGPVFPRWNESRVAELATGYELFGEGEGV